MDDNIVTLKPKRILAERIRKAMDAMARAATDFVESTMSLAFALKEAREEFPSNNEFGHWLVDEELEMDPHKRLALINMAQYAEISREVLRETKRDSIRLIWEEEIEPRLGSAAKTEPIPQVAAPLPQNPPQEAEKPQPAKTDEPISTPKVDPDTPKLSKRQQQTSPLARYHPEAYAALSNVGKLRTVFNVFTEKAHYGINAEPWRLYLAGLVKSIVRGLKVPSDGIQIKVAWGFPDGLPERYPDRGFCENTGFKSEDAKQFFAVLRKAQTWKPPLPPPPLPVGEIKHYTIGEPIVSVSGIQVFPHIAGRWTLDDACVAIEIVNALWVGADNRTELRHILSRDFQLLACASSLDGFIAALRHIANAITPDMSPLSIVRPRRPTRFAK